MTRYIAGRVLQAVPTLLGVAVVIFFLTRMVPGSPVDMMAGAEASPAEIAALEERLGLDRPLPLQFTEWIGGAIVGEFGNSYSTGRTVSSIMARAIPVTVTLSIGAFIVCILIGVPLAVLAAFHRGRFTDHAFLIGSLTGVSVPSFVLGLILILIFAVQLGWLPATGYIPISVDPLESLKGFILPSVSLGLLFGATVARVGRAATLEAISKDCILTSRALALTEARIRYRHALKLAAIPILTVLGVALGSLLGGTVVTERVFDLPGLGTVMINSVLRRDYPVIQAVVLLITGIYIVINLLVDVAYAAVDPRVRAS